MYVIILIGKLLNEEREAEVDEQREILFEEFSNDRQQKLEKRARRPICFNSHSDEVFNTES